MMTASRSGGLPRRLRPGMDRRGTCRAVALLMRPVFVIDFVPCRSDQMGKLSCRANFLVASPQRASVIRIKILRIYESPLFWPKYRELLNSPNLACPALRAQNYSSLCDIYQRVAQIGETKMRVSALDWWKSGHETDLATCHLLPGCRLFPC